MSASAGLPKALRDIHRALYDATPAFRPRVTLKSIRARPARNPEETPRHVQVTYGDIITALRHCDDARLNDVPLLGAHGVGIAEREALAGTRDVNAAEVLAGALNIIRGQLAGSGGPLAMAGVADTHRTPALERALRALLRRAVVRNGATNTRWSWHERSVQTVHRLNDRRAAGRVRLARALGAPAPLLFQGHMLQRRPDPVQVVIYVDVSGSMNQVLPHLRRALRSLQREARPTLYWFSTTVVPATVHDLDRGQFPTTRGTDIGAVITHAAQHLPQGSAALVITDGHFERVSTTRAVVLKRAGISLHLGVVGDGPLHAHDEWVASSVSLPSPEHRS